MDAYYAYFTSYSNIPLLEYQDLSSGLVRVHVYEV